ncbi:AAA family ATPase [Pasteurella multocida]|uniref:AAA family ATPase n=1 Tax=Pasteurella multocida TaxID=747 RepID=A0A9X3US13_PASMD|nr:AAA family ATPase [Pasteurella multocida]MDA5624292.1 AAA family ATPase [Pasteurella multocida]
MTLAQQIQQILDSKTFMQRDIAQQSGISAGALSAYLKGTYAGNIENIENALENWLKNQDKKIRSFIEAPEFIQTPTAERIFNALEMARFTTTIVPIYGASGVGKTKACQEFKKQNQNVWMITISPSRASLNAFLYELALELGFKDAPRRKDRLSRMIVEKLTGTRGIVIVDESDHLTYDAIEELRYIQEKAEVGFALIGNDRVYTRMQGGINPAHEHARLWNRLGNRCAIKASEKEDIQAVAAAWQLDTKDKELMKALYDIGTKAGGLRALTQYLRLAGIAAKGQGVAINLDLILQAKMHMQGAI